MNPAVTKLHKIDNLINNKYDIPESGDFAAIKAYADAVYEYLVNNYKYDYDLAKELLPITDQEARRKRHDELISLEKCILAKKGLCRQLSELHITLVASRIFETGSNVRCGILDVNFTINNGTISPHSVSFLYRNNNLFIYDVTSGLYRSVKLYEPKAFCGINSQGYPAKAKKYMQDITSVQSKTIKYVEPKPLKLVFECFNDLKNALKIEDMTQITTNTIFSPKPFISTNIY